MSFDAIGEITKPALPRLCHRVGIRRVGSSICFSNHAH